jgi:hypothetical protein
MKTFVGLFAISAIFGLLVDATYWFVAGVEPAGVALLSIMTAGLIFCAGYAFVAERDAALEGDDPNKPAERLAGETIEVFTTHSPWPICVAACVLAMLTGVIWSPMLCGLGFAGMLYCCYRLGRESSQV